MDTQSFDTQPSENEAIRVSPGKDEQAILRHVQYIIILL